MACFLVSAAEAIVVTAAAQIVRRSERSKESVKLERTAEKELAQEQGMTWSAKLMLLAKLLWGGAFLLAYEHVWHGEVVPWFPFLTAMNDPEDTAEMLHEMGTIGVTMACIVTVVWLAIILISDVIAKRKDTKPADSIA